MDNVPFSQSGVMEASPPAPLTNDEVVDPYIPWFLIFTAIVVLGTMWIKRRRE